jgi:hypothetical protein
MIDREEEIKELKFEILERFPKNVMKIFIDNDIVGTIYIKNEMEKSFWISTLKTMNEKLRLRELNL